MNEHPIKLDTASLRMLHSATAKILVASFSAFFPCMLHVICLSSCLPLLSLFLLGLSLATLIEASLKKERIGASLGLWDEALSLNACAILVHHIAHS